MTEVLTPASWRLQFVDIINPLDPRDREVQSIGFLPGQSIADIWPNAPAEAGKFVYSINGELIDDNLLHLARPGNGDFVSRIPVIAGDEAKNVLRMVAIIAVAFYAPTLAAEIAYAAGGGMFLGSTTGLAMLTVGVQVAGALVVNSLLPPAKRPSGASSSSDSPTYGIDGPKNTSAEGIVAPVVYGKHRFGGNIISNFIVNDGETQILHMLINAGEGPVASLDQIELDDQPITNYSDAESDIALGTSNQAVLKWFGDVMTPRSVNQVITGTAKYFTTLAAVDRLRIDLVAPGGLFQVLDDGTFELESVPITIEIRKQGTVPWLPFNAVNKVSSYSLVTEWNQVPTGYSEYTGSYTFTTYSPTGSEYFVNNGDGTGLYYATNPLAGDGDAVPVGQKVKVAGYAITDTITMEGATRSPIRRSFLSQPLENGIYEIRYLRQTVPSIDTSVVDVVNLLEVNEIQTEQIAYRNTALVAVKVKINEQLSHIPNVTFMHGGMIVRVYDETTGTWVSRASNNPAWIVWDILTNARIGGGAAYSRLDLAKWREWAKYCSDNNLEFNGVFDTQSNIWDAANAVARCGRAQVIQVGTRYSVVIEKAETPTMMFTAANIVSGSFKETWLSMGDRANEIEVSFSDKNDRYRRRTVKLYDQAAISAGEPVRTATLDIMGVVDPDRAYAEADLLLKMNRYIQRTVQFSAPIEAVACVAGDVIYVQHDMPQWGYAGRFGPASTTTNLVLDRPVPMEAGATYRALIHYPALQRYQGTIQAITGDLILINGYTGTNWGELRLRKSSGTPETEVTEVVQQGANYGVRVASTAGFALNDTVQLWQTNAIVDVAVTNVVGSGTVDQSSLTCAALPQAPAEFDKWMFGKVNKVAKPFRVRQVAGSHDYRRDITAIEYNEAIYAGPGASIPSLDYSDLNDRQVSPPTGVEFTERLVVSGDIILTEVTVSYRSDQASYLTTTVLTSFQMGPWVEVGRNFSQVSFIAPEGEFIRVRLIAHDRFGNASPSPLDTYYSYFVNGKTAPPGDVLDLTAVIKPLHVQIAWTKPVDLDYKTTELRYLTPDILEQTWINALPLFGLGPTVSNNQIFNWLRPPNGEYTILARHVDTSGKYSVLPATALITVDDSIDAGTEDLVLGQTLFAVVSDAAGVVSNYSTATTTAKVMLGPIDKTSLWTIGVAGSSGLAASYDDPTDTVSLTSINSGTDNGTITITATEIVTPPAVARVLTKTISVVKVKRGADGSSGAAGNNVATVYLYQWYTSGATPPSNTASTSLDWTTLAHTGTPNNGWSTSVPANPGTSSLQLWVMQKAVSAPSGTTSSTVSWASGFTKQAYTANGATGSQGPQGTQGVPGTRSAFPTAYQWGAGAPAPTATGSATYTWASGTYDTPPSGWTTTPGSAPGPGQTLWQVEVRLVDSSTVSTTGINWATGSVSAISYAGTNGANGATGAQGAAARVAYSLVTGGVGALSPTPASIVVAGDNRPANDSWGAGTSWVASAPNPAAGQSVWVTDGIYDPVLNQTTWFAPYLASLRVGQLSAITVNTGALTVSDVLTMGAAGQVKSSNYVAGVSGWSLSPTVAEIPAAAIRGTLTVNWTDVSGRPGDLAGLDSASATKLSGVATGATANRIVDKTTTPTGADYPGGYLATGDIWNKTINTSSGIRQMQTYRWSGSAWVPMARSAIWAIGTASAQAWSDSDALAAIQLYGLDSWLPGDVVTLKNGNWSETRRLESGANGWVQQIAIFKGDVLVDGTVTAQKMNVTQLSAITATIGTLRTATSGARTEIKDNLIEIYDSSNVLRVKLGVW